MLNFVTYLWDTSRRLKIRPRIIIITGAIGFLLIGWFPLTRAADRVSVFVSILPQKYFVQKVGGDLVDVSVLVEPGASPSTYEPKPKQMVSLAKSKIYYAIGVPFEKVWLPKIASINPQMKVVRTDDGIAKIPITVHHHHGKKESSVKGFQPEENGHHEIAKHSAKGAHDRIEDNHGHGQLDPHIWLSPPLVMVQARKILTALQEVDPVHHSVYEANYRAFISELADLDAELRNTFEGGQGLEFLVFHPSWGYFAKAYGLKQSPIEIEGKNPKPAQLKEIIEYAKQKDIRVIFVQPQFSTKSAELIAKSIGAEIVFADPLAEDWAVNLRRQARKFRAALK